MQYGLAMILVFILQVSAAITAFTMISNSRNMVTDQLDWMMREYGYGESQVEVDWIQSKVSVAQSNRKIF